MYILNPFHSILVRRFHLGSLREDEGNVLALSIWDLAVSRHTFATFWLRSTEVSVLISLISDNRCIVSFEISPMGLLNAKLAW